MVSSRSRSVARRQKEMGIYYYMELDWYDMATLCSSTESRIGERKLLFELEFGRRYYIKILWFLPARDRWLADRRRWEFTTTWNWTDMIWLLSAHRGSPTEGDGKLLLHGIGWIWYGYSLLIDRVEDRREEATIWIGFWTEDIILRYYGFFPLVIGGSPTEGDGKLLLEIGLMWYGYSLHRQSRGQVERKLLFELDLEGWYITSDVGTAYYYFLFLTCGITREN